MRQVSLLTDAELTGLKAVQSDKEWDALYEQIQQAHGGRLPTDWWEAVIQSGLAEGVMDTYGAQSNASFQHLAKKDPTEGADN